MYAASHICYDSSENHNSFHKKLIEHSYSVWTSITPARTVSISGLKSRDFLLKNDGEKWSGILF